MPLANFIICLVDADYRLLYKPGQQGKINPTEIWDKILLEYAEISGNDSMKRMISVSKEIGVLKAKIFATRTAVFLLSQKYNDVCVEVLRKIGFDYNYKDNLFESLVLVSKKAKSFDFELSQKLKEYSNITTSKHVKGVTKEYFTRQLVELSKFMGYRIDPVVITVSEFVTIKKRFDDEMKQIQLSYGK